MTGRSGVVSESKWWAAPGGCDAACWRCSSCHGHPCPPAPPRRQHATRRGVRAEDMGQTYLAEPDADADEARTLRPLQAAAVTYRIAFGPRAGQKVLTLRGAMPREGTADSPCAPTATASDCTPRCESRRTTASGWNSGAATSPDRLCPTSGFSSTLPGRWRLKLKTLWRNGTTHLVMSPLKFMLRLAALVPRPQLHLIRFHGVLAPNQSCGHWWCRRDLRCKSRPLKLRLPANARPRRFRPGRPASSAGRGCSSACSISTCSTAGTGVQSRHCRPSKARLGPCPGPLNFLCAPLAAYWITWAWILWFQQLARCWRPESRRGADNHLSNCAASCRD